MRKRNWQSLGRNNFFNWELSIDLILIKSRLNQLQMYFARIKIGINKTRCSLLNFNFVIVETFAYVITRLPGAIYLGIVIDVIHRNVDKRKWWLRTWLFKIYLKDYAWKYVSHLFFEIFNRYICYANTCIMKLKNL